MLYIVAFARGLAAVEATIDESYNSYKSVQIGTYWHVPGSGLNRVSSIFTYKHIYNSGQTDHSLIGRFRELRWCYVSMYSLYIHRAGAQLGYYSQASNNEVFWRAARHLNVSRDLLSFKVSSKDLNR